MAGLFDAIWGDPSGQALTALGSGLLGVRRGNEGRAIYGAMDAYNQAQQEQRRNALVEIQKRMAEAQLKGLELTQADQAALRQFWSKPENFMGAGQSAFPPNEMDPEGSPASGAVPLAAGVVAQNMLKSGVPALAQQGFGALQKDEVPLVLGEGARAVTRDGRTIASNPKGPGSMPSGLQEYLFAVQQGYKGTFEQWDTSRKRAGATNVQFNTGEKGYKHSRDLANDFRQEPIYKAHTEVSSAYQQIVQGLNSESPAGDLTAATKFMKILDPGSVVRESELQMAMQATGLGDRITNYVQMVMSGNKLTPAQRRDFRNVATRLYEESEKLYRAKQGQYQQIAKDNQLDGRMLDMAGVKGAKVPQTVDDLVNHYTQDQ